MLPGLHTAHLWPPRHLWDGTPCTVQSPAKRIVFVKLTCGGQDKNTSFLLSPDLERLFADLETRSGDRSSELHSVWALEMLNAVVETRRLGENPAPPAQTSNARTEHCS